MHTFGASPFGGPGGESGGSWGLEGGACHGLRTLHTADTAYYNLVVVMGVFPGGGGVAGGGGGGAMGQVCFSAISSNFAYPTVFVALSSV